MDFASGIAAPSRGCRIGSANVDISLTGNSMFRWLAVAILLGAVGTSTYYRQRARRESETIPRRREGGLFMAVRAFVALFLLITVMAYAAIPQRMTWASFVLPAWIRWLGSIAGLLTISAVAWVLRSLGHNVSETVLTKKEHQLIMVGPYQWIRHPLYTTGIILFVALGLMPASWLLLLIAGFSALLIYLLVVPAEERALIAKFGDQYRGYTRGTGRLLPRVPWF
jgi:protein-S-isoprenylcysteine O-methyltransferase Ste14